MQTAMAKSGKGAVHAAIQTAVAKSRKGAVQGAVKGAVKGAAQGAVQVALQGAVRGAVQGGVQGAVQCAVLWFPRWDRSIPAFRNRKFFAMVTYGSQVGNHEFQALGTHSSLQ